MQLKPNFGAMLHTIAATAMGGDLDGAQQRTAEIRSSRPLPKLSIIQRGFSSTTESDYVARLIEGLRLAGFDE